MRKMKFTRRVLIAVCGGVCLGVMTPPSIYGDVTYELAKLKAEKKIFMLTEKKKLLEQAVSKQDEAFKLTSEKTCQFGPADVAFVLDRMQRDKVQLRLKEIQSELMVEIEMQKKMLKMKL